MDEILRDIGADSVGELFNTILRTIENELSDIEDMLFEDNFDKFDVVDKIISLRSQLI